MDYFKKPVEVKEQANVDFDDILKQLDPLSKSAKVYFLWKFIQTLSPGMCKTVIKYLYQRLNTLNSTT